MGNFSNFHKKVWIGKFANFLQKKRGMGNCPNFFTKKGGMGNCPNFLQKKVGIDNFPTLLQENNNYFATKQTEKTSQQQLETFTKLNIGEFY